MLDLIPWDVGAKALAANASAESQATCGHVYATRPVGGSPRVFFYVKVLVRIFILKICDNTEITV